MGSSKVACCSARTFWSSMLCDSWLLFAHVEKNLHAGCEKGTCFICRRKWSHVYSLWKLMRLLLSKAMVLNKFLNFVLCRTGWMLKQEHVVGGEEIGQEGSHIYKCEKVQAGTCCCWGLAQLWKHAAWPMGTLAQVQVQMLPAVPQSAIDQAAEFAFQVLIVPHRSLVLLNIGSCCISSTHSSSSVLLSDGRRDGDACPSPLLPASLTGCNCLISAEIQIRRSTIN